jgi:hypothetical protein
MSWLLLGFTKDFHTLVLLGLGPKITIHSKYITYPKDLTAQKNGAFIQHQIKLNQDKIMDSCLELRSRVPQLLCENWPQALMVAYCDNRLI